MNKRCIEDESDSYNYEKGAYSHIPLFGDNSTGVLNIGERQGNFEGMQRNRQFVVKLGDATQTINYTGKKTAIILKNNIIVPIIKS